MTHVLVRHKVNDYPAWKKEFDNFVDFRKSSGEQAYQILQKDGDNNNLYLLFQWDNEDNARKFFQALDPVHQIRVGGQVGRKLQRFFALLLDRLEEGDHPLRINARSHDQCYFRQIPASGMD